MRRRSRRRARLGLLLLAGFAVAAVVGWFWVYGRAPEPLVPVPGKDTESPGEGITGSDRERLRGLIEERTRP